MDDAVKAAAEKISKQWVLDEWVPALRGEEGPRVHRETVCAGT